MSFKQNQSSLWKRVISHDGNEGEEDDKDESEDRYEGHESLNLSDVFFVVGAEEKVVPAHKMFTNGMLESGSSEIFLSDASLEAFAAMFQGDIDMKNSMDMDSKSQFRSDPLGVLEALLWRTNFILAISEHGARSSIYDEAKAVVHKNKAAPEEATRDSPSPDGVRGINCIMKDMYGETVTYESIQLSRVAPEGFYRVIVDEAIRDDVQLFMEGDTLGDISSGKAVVWHKSLTCFE
ncbi:hypothetical protein GIB67_032041 [Kingdonia uniflora]|uniref:TOD1/MUCI70 glycosyltransferase-like domain-containing protein n=1 Tax=Kingdonia uniflora TaxID=39325 RepID=A0A7J7MWX3_9MAGN|nr:hypothetical protein GIB67_032041 [Kingdonia uniflora]